MFMEKTFQHVCVAYSNQIMTINIPISLSFFTWESYDLLQSFHRYTNLLWTKLPGYAAKHKNLCCVFVVLFCFVLFCFLNV